MRWSLRTFGIMSHELVKEEQNRLLEKVNAYKLAKKIPEKTMVEKDVAIKSMKWSIMDLKRALNPRKTEKSS